ncbi:MAG: ImmA/IrrE family metallo-endopeptidase [Planctomycetota bacterium]
MKTLVTPAFPLFACGTGDKDVDTRLAASPEASVTPDFPDTQPRLAVTDDAPESLVPAFDENYNPRMLTLAREAQRLTQAALAEAVGVSQPLVARWEDDTTDSHDRRCPSPDQAERLGEVLTVDPDLFFLGSDFRVRGSGLMRDYGSEFYHRSRQKARRSDIKAIHARCRLTELRVERLLRGSESTEDMIPDIDPDDHAGDIERVATLARLRMGLASGPIRDLTELIERNGGLIIDRDLEADGMDALCRWVEGLPKLFYLNGDAPGDRMRWSLAHELGHTVMHFGRDVEFRLAEEQANAFAGAFLMPVNDVRRDFACRVDLDRLAQLKRKWRVSMQALAYRAHRLGCIDATRFKSIFTQMSRRGWRKTEPVSVSRESPLGYKRLIRQHQDAGFSPNDLARILLLPASSVNELLIDSNSPDWREDGVRLRLAR